MQIAAFFKKAGNCEKRRFRKGGEFRVLFALTLQMDVFQWVELVGERNMWTGFGDWHFQAVADRRNARTEKEWGTP